MFRMSDEGPEQKLKFRTVCQDCSWADDRLYDEWCDCTISICPECGSDNIVDEREWV